MGQVEEFAEEGTRWPIVVFGPEGCGKTAFLRQAAAMLRELGYDVFYLHPLDRVFSAEVDDPDVKRLFLDLVRRTLEDGRWGRLAMAVFDLTREILRRRKVAVIADDVFQAIGLDKAAYVKGLLNMIEHPSINMKTWWCLWRQARGSRGGRSGGIGGPASCPCGIWRGTAFCSCMKKSRAPSLLSKRPGGSPAETRTR